MGASRRKLFISILLEGIFLTAAGSLLGLILGHSVLWIFIRMNEESQKAGLTTAVFYNTELVLLGGSILLGVISSLIPAIQAFRTDIHAVLADN